MPDPNVYSFPPLWSTLDGDNVNEGRVFTIRVESPGKPPGSTIYYSIRHYLADGSGRVTKEDFVARTPDQPGGLDLKYMRMNSRPTSSSFSLIGSEIVNDGGFATLTLGIAVDGFTEGAESVEISFYENGYDGPVDKHFVFNIVDTSMGSTRVHRLLNELTGEHLFSSNLSEVDYLTGLRYNHAQGYGTWLWQDEGVAFNSAEGANQPVHRFFNGKTGKHFYTANDGEANLAISSNSSLVY